ncbi:MAG: stage III sporulation protein AF [Clostridiales bacterium]|jgi:stage III sporulation protein AF|nr:stage III sporulation protein AF [Clostridiales bacterium]
MLSWIISIAGVIVLTVLLDIIMPDGQTNKYIKGIFSIIVILVIVTPLTGVLRGDFNFDTLFSTDRYSVDENYVQSVYSSAYASEEERLVRLLAGEGITVEQADIVFQPADKRKIAYINIFIRKSVIDSDGANININDKIQEIVARRYGILKQDIRILPFYGV